MAAATRRHKPVTLYVRWAVQRDTDEIARVDPSMAGDWDAARTRFDTIPVVCEGRGRGDRLAGWGVYQLQTGRLVVLRAIGSRDALLSLAKWLVKQKLFSHRRDTLAVGGVEWRGLPAKLRTSDVLALAAAGAPAWVLADAVEEAGGFGLAAALRGGGWEGEFLAALVAVG